jgi:hypothetical protein
VLPLAAKLTRHLLILRVPRVSAPEGFWALPRPRHLESTDGRKSGPPALLLDSSVRYTAVKLYSSRWRLALATAVAVSAQP